MVKFADIVKEAEDANFTPGEGWTGMVQIKNAGYKIQDDGYPRFWIILEVVGGKDSGKDFITNLGFGKGKAKMNDMNFAKFEAIGIPRSVFSKNPEPEEVVAMLTGRKVNISKVTKSKTSDFMNYTFTSVAPDVDDDDDI